MTQSPLATLARRFITECDKHRPPPPLWAQALCVVEEAGEFAGAWRRWTGHARRDGTIGDAAAELADVVITAYVFAERAGIDLDSIVHQRRKLCDSLDTVSPWMLVLDLASQAGRFGERFAQGYPDELIGVALADLVVDAYIFAERVGIDLHLAVELKGRVIMSRGYGVDNSTGRAA